MASDRRSQRSHVIVSICIPVYNAAPYVAQTIEAALAQTYPDLEIIVVDDGSTDGSFEVLQCFADRVTVIRQDNAGAAAARNRAFATSKGNKILFLDGDDWIAPDHVAALVAAAGDKEDVIAFSRWDRFRKDPSEAVFPARETERDMSGVEWLLIDWRDTQPMMQCGMFLLPRSLLERLGGWDERLSLVDDFEFFARMISNCKGMIFAEGAALYYRSGLEESLSGRKSRPAVESQFLALSLGGDHLIAAQNNRETRLAVANVIQQFIYEHYPNHGDLCARAANRVADLGGADAIPIGPPNFHKLRRIIGWRAARRVQRMMGR